MTRKLWVPALVALLVAALVGPTVATAAEPRLTTKSIMVPASAFIPTRDDWDYSNDGVALSMSIGSGNFTAPLAFPVSEVNIKRITLYAYDNGAGNICVTAHRSRPAGGAADWAGGPCTADNPANPQAVFSTATGPGRRVNTALHGPYLWLTIGGPGMKVYGVKVNFTYESGV